MPFGGLVHPASVERGSNNAGAPARQHGSGLTGHLFAPFRPEARTTATAADPRTPVRPGRPHA
jgi:hypothetical protein